ncbi:MULTISPECIES: GGDEF domain-containing protein [Shewanella]|uniref:GGDEF domain-containing protein n=1 Tax=Shewanella marisflavi TaxID=260364 RepID=A0AAC9TV46_9GAMM|nr:MULTISPECIES: GGDEF domain-containing protein [Shewanella]ASJ95745.1 GGDEF domain-containing protein [Shewanella marisflavi]MCL1041731.1 GGDEF domain-containing protein [Shewanella marisflavi]QDF74308.1 GGDEF domain-containing protein [Shewanella marisflavi]
MLLQCAETSLWLRESGHPAITLPRWQQQVDLLNEFYQSKACIVLQHIEGEYQVVCSRQDTDLNLYAGTLFHDASLTQALSAHTGYGLLQFTSSQDSKSHLAQFSQLLALPLYWSDGQPFGVILICDSQRTKHFRRLLPLLENSKALIQSELKHLFLMQQIQMMSVQDDLTCMLNPYGFNLMAPRQLSLSRRFGSHAGIVLLQDLTQYKGTLEQSQGLRQLARVIHHNMRDADVSARIEDGLFAILAFVDNQANLDALTKRLLKQIAKEEIKAEIAIGVSFFTPNTHLAIEPMVEAARQNLQASVIRQQKNYTA